ncbi:MAG: hypothetical protein Q4B79_01810 [Moraxella sp.]|uniref:hypothetical protein n=1 Tax=Moraxella sp. TaxID=479 RepID=UPI0026DBD1A5|nr:hypothetical protein [Moraxella sp.]MDO4449678.1 hypothetical protein [Moraxella sp.]
MSAFVQFEFDNDVLRLWQSIPAGGKNFAYHQRLANLAGAEEATWGVNLDSLKVVDVLLSAIKSDLAGKNITEERAVAHPDFARLFVVLFYHVVAVIDGVLSVLAKSTAMPKPKLTIYTADGFGRVYARLFSSMQEAFASVVMADELDDFYYGAGVLCQGVNPAGREVATRLFILPIIATRLFGSMERAFASDLNDDGQKIGTAEDSLYWAVHDFIERIKALQSSDGGSNHAKALFCQTSQSPKTDVSSNTNSIAEPIPQAPNQPSQNTPSPQNPMPTSVVNPTSSTPQKSHVLPPSAYKQKARASHTPKLFLEAYQDLKNINTPSDAVHDYQRASMTLNKFDEFIEDKLSKGDLLDNITFSDQQQHIRKQALSLLVGLIKQGNTSAMLRLALYYFEGRGVGIDVAKATMLTKRASEAGDIRAQKLLSRLYYQGFRADDGGVAMDVMLGEHWLKKSADGGHPEAKKVCAYMNQVEVLKDSYRTEKASDKRYGMLLLGVSVGALLLLIVLSIIL